MDARFPIGPFTMPAAISSDERARYIEVLARHPAELRSALTGISAADLELRYREGGWTIRQVVHHLADSHVNSYVRFKLALTEDTPGIKTYDEARWAELPDISVTPVDVSLQLLESLHQRWTALLLGLQPNQFERCVQHPDWGTVSVDQLLALYAWHCQHHVAHVEQALSRAVQS